MAASDSKSLPYDEERIHDAREWLEEARAVIKDVQDCVKLFSISRVPVSDVSVHLNLTTLEEQNYTIELSAAGFRVVGEDHDVTSSPSHLYFETPYSLLDNLSPLYRVHFCSAVSAKLEALAAQQLP
ncbi:Protein of unknown function DUF727 [Trinorchestia longiramus]|nr:Protein of unknown function DUF727 [Trinorchestia longiramus]